MSLRGQGNRNNGYAMVALLISLSIAAILLTAAMPVWKQLSQREKEEELVFRGLQYARALRLFSQKYANASPPSIDVLVEQRFLRKKYKDPITNDDFQPLLAGQALPGTSGGAQSGSGGRAGAGAGARGGPGGGASQSPFGGGIQTGGQSGGRAGAAPGVGAGTPGSTFTQIGSPGAGPVGGIIGVVSKSKAKSIRLYNGRNHYNEWAFINTPQTQAPGVGAPGTNAPGQRGGPGFPGQTGQPGASPFGSGIGGQRGRSGQPNQPQQPGTRGGGPGGFPIQQSPFAPAQPIQPGRGRGGM